MSDLQACPDCNQVIGTNSSTCLACERSLWTGAARIAHLEQQLAEARDDIDEVVQLLWRKPPDVAVSIKRLNQLRTRLANNSETTQ